MGISHRWQARAGSAKRISFRFVPYGLCALLLGMWPWPPQFIFGQDGDIAEGRFLQPDLHDAVIESQTHRVVLSGEAIGINLVTVRGTRKDLPREAATTQYVQIPLESFEHLVFSAGNAALA